MSPRSEPRPMARANILVVLGAILILGGGVLVWDMSRDDDEPRSSQATVLLATTDLAPGLSGDDLAADGRVRIAQVDAGDVADGALTSPTELTDTIVGTSVPAGEQVVAASLRPAALRTSAFEVPEDAEAVAVTVPFTAGVAGYVGPGDRVNVYASIAPSAPGAPVSPRTELLVGGVEVLDVSDEVAPRRADVVTEDVSTAASQPARDGAEEITLLLALDTIRAEQIIFAASNDRLWFTLAPDDGSPPTSTPGVEYSTYGPAGKR
jgi:Flp pilus assembly protein CpaB